MYAAVSSRAREIATLRALGFSRLPVVVSVMIESLVFGLIGAAFGGAASWLLFDGFRAATINWASFSQVAFAFQVTPELLVQGTTLALVIGAIGGFLPAVGAARRSVVGRSASSSSHPMSRRSSGTADLQVGIIRRRQVP